jgi:hypothetical protein
MQHGDMDIEHTWSMNMEHWRAEWTFIKKDMQNRHAWWKSSMDIQYGNCSMETFTSSSMVMQHVDMDMQNGQVAWTHIMDTQNGDKQMQHWHGHAAETWWTWPCSDCVVPAKLVSAASATFERKPTTFKNRRMRQPLLLKTGEFWTRRFSKSFRKIESFWCYMAKNLFIIQHKVKVTITKLRVNICRTLCKQRQIKPCHF